MAELSNIAAQLSKGKNVESNLSKYAAGLNTLYNRVGYVTLAMNLYTFAEVYGEQDEYAKILKPFADRLKEILRDSVLAKDSEKAKTAVTKIDGLRNELIAGMEVLTAYTDRFQIFEYVLNRIEYNYKECDANLDYYDEKFERDILNYIVSDKDNSVVNMKISQVVGQLPMRLSKNKFFELLRGGFSVYKDAEVSSVDDFVYMLRSVSMLYVPSAFDTAFPVLSEALKALLGFSYADMDEPAYDAARERLEDAGDYVMELTDRYVLLMDVVNDAYTVLLSGEAPVSVQTELENSERIMEASLLAIENNALPDEKALELFEVLEGVQEKTYTQLSGDSYALDDVKTSYMDRAEALGMKETYEKLFKAELLNSGSSFMTLETAKTAEVLADEAYLEEQYNKVAAELSELFSKQERVFNRAVMAGILSTLPVFFNNMEEIRSYIHVALGQCRDDAERKACMTLMMALMNE